MLRGKEFVLTCELHLRRRWMLLPNDYSQFILTCELHPSTWEPQGSPLSSQFILTCELHQYLFCILTCIFPHNSYSRVNCIGKHIHSFEKPCVNHLQFILKYDDISSSHFANDRRICQITTGFLYLLWCELLMESMSVSCSHRDGLCLHPVWFN